MNGTQQMVNTKSEEQAGAAKPAPASATEGQTTPVPETGNGGSTPSTEGKTFTQGDVNRIVQERLAKERAKAQPEQDAFAAREQELAKREFLMDAKETLREKGFNEELLGALNAPDKDTLAASLSIIEKVYGDPKKSTPKIVAPASGAIGGHFDPIRNAMGLRNL